LVYLSLRSDFAQPAMDSKDGFWDLQPPTCSKRPNASSAEEDNRDVKKFRTQPCEESADRNFLHNGLQFPYNDNSSVPSHDTFYGYEHRFDNASTGWFDGLTSEQLADTPFDSLQGGQKILENAYDSLPNTHEELPSSDLMLGQTFNQPKLELPPIIETFPGYLPYQGFPTNSFLSPLAQLDTSIDNTAIYCTPTPGEPLGEAQPFIKASSPEDIRETLSQEYTAIPDTRPGLDGFQSDQLTSGISQVNESPRTSATSLSPESADVCSNYDTCFGVVSRIYPRKRQYSDRSPDNSSAHLVFCAR
jgi:hypothetical protein